MEKQRLWIRWLGGSLLTISLLFFSNGNVSAAKILTKYGSLPLYREDLMPLTVERPSFMMTRPFGPSGCAISRRDCWRLKLDFIVLFMASCAGGPLSFARYGPSSRPKAPTFLRLWGPRKSSHFWCASPVPTAARPSVRLPLFLQDRGLSKFLSLNLESQSRMGIGGSFRRKCPAYAIIKDNLSQFGTSHWAWGP